MEFEGKNSPCQKHVSCIHRNSLFTFDLKHLTHKMKLIVIVFALTIGLHAISASTVTFGISISTQAWSDFLNQNGKEILAGLEYFVEQANTWNILINNKTDLLTFAIKSMEDYGNSTIVAQNYLEMLNDSEINFFLGPASSPLSAVAKRITEPAGRLLLGTKVGSSTFYTGAEFSFSVTTSPPRYATTVLPEFRIKGISSIVLVVEQTPFQLDIAKGFVSNAEDFSINVIYQYNVMSDTLLRIDDNFIANITATVALIRSLDQSYGISGVVIASFTNVGKYFLEAAKKINYMPRAIFISSFHLPDFQELDPTLTAFVSGCDVIAPGINFRGDYFGTYEEFQTGFNNSRPDLAPASSNHATGAVSGLLIMLSIISADSLNNNEVTRALGRTNKDTFFGPYQFGSDHSQLRFVPIMQLLPNPERIRNLVSNAQTITNLANIVGVVGPSRVARNTLVYPAPTWDERIFDPKYTEAEYTIMGITAGNLMRTFVSSFVNKVLCSGAIVVNSVHCAYSNVPKPPRHQSSIAIVLDLHLGGHFVVLQHQLHVDCDSIQQRQLHLDTNRAGVGLCDHIRCFICQILANCHLVQTSREIDRHDHQQQEVNSHSCGAGRCTSSLFCRLGGVF